MNINILAQAAQQAQGGDGLQMIITFVLIGVIFYFLLIRPQRKQQKEMQERQNSLKPGDKVVSAGGIYGIIREVQDAAVKMEIAPNTVIKIAKTSIVSTIAKDGSTEGNK